MTYAEAAARWAEAIANDNSHGYSQSNRWGPSYDCSSLVIAAYKQAGIPLTCTYTGNMKAGMLAKGFTDVTGQVNLVTGAGMKRGDVLLNEASHAALYVGGGKLVQARSDFDGVPGDSSGREISVQSYYNYPWDCVLRPPGGTAAGGTDATGGTAAQSSDTYSVQKGDSLWDIADRYLGSGLKWKELQALNGLTGTALQPGQVLKLKAESAKDKPTETETASGAYWPPRILKLGMVGPDVSAAQALLTARGYYTAGVNRSYDSTTVEAVIRFQNDNGLEGDGETGPLTWSKLTKI